MKSIVDTVSIACEFTMPPPRPPSLPIRLFEQGFEPTMEKPTLRMFTFDASSHENASRRFYRAALHCLHCALLLLPARERTDKEQLTGGPVVHRAS